MTNNGPALTASDDLESESTASQCPVCPHAWADHDVIGRRFCSAKIAGGSSRGCVCTTTG